MAGKRNRQARFNAQDRSGTPKDIHVRVTAATQELMLANMEAYPNIDYISHLASVYITERAVEDGKDLPGIRLRFTEALARVEAEQRDEAYAAVIAGAEKAVEGLKDAIALRIDAEDWINAEQRLTEEEDRLSLSTWPSKLKVDMAKAIQSCRVDLNWAKKHA